MSVMSDPETQGSVVVNIRWNMTELGIAPIVRSIVASCDRSYNQSWHPATDRTINRGILRPIVQSIVASVDRSHNQSWHPATDRTINRGIRRPIVRSNVASSDRSHDQSWHPATDRTINRGILRPSKRLAAPPVVRSCNQSGQVVSSRTTPNVTSYDGPPWHHQSSVVRPVTRPIVRLHDPRSSTTGGATM